MRHHRSILVFFAITFLAVTSAWAQSIPPMIPHSGTVAVNGTPFNGTGQFKFAIVSKECQANPPTGCLSFWSNDDTSANGSEPTNAISLAVTNGLFSLKLGDTGLTNMQAIPTTVFNNSETFLRIWFNDGVTGFQQLSPDRQLVSVPYAFKSEVANTVVGTGGVGSAQIAEGAVTTPKIADKAVGSGQINPNFMAFKSLSDPTGGWNPDGILTSFTIEDGAIPRGSLRPIGSPPEPVKTIVLVSFVDAGAVVCAVSDINLAPVIFRIGDSGLGDFRLVCNNPPANGATLNYVVINP